MSKEWREAAVGNCTLPFDNGVDEMCTGMEPSGLNASGEVILFEA